MFTYKAFGLGICSDIALPAWDTVEVAEDVYIHLNEDYHHRPLSVEENVHIHIGRETSVVALQGIGTYSINHGREIQVYPHPEVDWQVIQSHLVGNIMAVLLYQRGYLVLHASAINYHGEGVAFLGASGNGKSSLAAGLHLFGHHMVVDDILAMKTDRDSYLVQPGPPKIKIHIKAAQVLGINAQELVQRADTDGKYWLNLSGDQVNSCVTLKQIYVLEEGEQLQIEPEEAKTALFEIIRNSFPTRFSQRGDADHFRQCVDLADRISFYRLTIPNSIEQLPGITQTIEKHISKVGDYRNI